MNYYVNINDAPASDLLRKGIIETENYLMDLSDFSWQDCPDTVKSTGVYIKIYQCGPIDHGTHVPGPVPQSGAEIEYNTSCTAVMGLEHFRMLTHELLNKDPVIVPKEAPLVLLDSNSVMCIA